MKYRKSFERKWIQIELFVGSITGRREWKVRNSRIALLVHCHENILRVML